ncbi:MAG: hypothetical protein ACRDKG_11585 [Actinomycetota bacterium]
MTERPEDRIAPDQAEDLIAGRLPAGSPEASRRVAEVLAAAAARETSWETAAAGASPAQLASVAHGSKPRFAFRSSSPNIPLRYKVPNVALGVIVGLMVGGSAFAVAQTVAGHGGPKPRFHDAKVCNLVDVSKLPGNWTHGDYVSAVEAKDPSKVREAAQSDCGKPNHAGGKGQKENNKGGNGKEKGADEKEEGDEAPKSPAPEAPKPTPEETPEPSVTPTASPTAGSTEAPSIESPAPSSSASASADSQGQE